jgi:hypothetical protein
MQQQGRNKRRDHQGKLHFYVHSGQQGYEKCKYSPHNNQEADRNNETLGNNIKTVGSDSSHCCVSKGQARDYRENVKNNRQDSRILYPWPRWSLPHGSPLTSQSSIVKAFSRMVKSKAPSVFRAGAGCILHFIFRHFFKKYNKSCILPAPEKGYTGGEM